MAAEKRDKRSVSYTPEAKNRAERCEVCEHFQKPNGCELVSGAISPGGWCKLFENDGESVADGVREALAATYGFYFQAHSFHWNVTGPEFVQMHQFFGDLYRDAWYAVDGLAEQLRALGATAPTSPAEIQEASGITFDATIPDSRAMTQKLATDNDHVVEELGEALEAAEGANEQGLANYLQGRLDQHKKWGWMLKALLSEASVKDIAKRSRDTRLGDLLEKAGSKGNGSER